MRLRAAAALLLALVCFTGQSNAQLSGSGAVAPSTNTTDPCYSNPSAASCAGFERTDAEWSSDLQTLCTEMPFMVGCSMWAECKSGEAKADSAYCAPASLVADICIADAMAGMYGCEAHNKLCSNTSVVQQCQQFTAAPDVPTTFKAKQNIDGVCTSHAMDGCQDCTSVGRTNFRSCPEVFALLGRLCVSMPDMAQCQDWSRFCANADAASAFPLFCQGNAADSSSSALPPMKMWVHQGVRDIFLFKEWVPNNTGQYIGVCIGWCVLAVVTQFLKAVRLRMEMRWSAKLRCPCEPPQSLPAEDGGGSDISADASDCCGGPALDPKGSDLESGVSALEPSCCGAPTTAAAAEEQRVIMPSSQLRRRWRRGAGGGHSVLGVPLLGRAQAGRNLWRAAFTFFVMMLDYALMLVVMTFNLGAILAVCLGFALGALLFGHAGETQPGSGAEVRQVAPAGPTSELETVFVEGSACCSGGSGCGGGGHSGGQL